MVQPNLPKTLEEALQVQADFVGISKITKNNAEKFYKRGKVIQALGAVFILDEKRQIGRTATLPEVQQHIGKSFNIPNEYDDKKWEAKKKQMLKEITDTLILAEKSWEAEDDRKEEDEKSFLDKDAKKKTINEENEEAKKKLEDIGLVSS
tara:strand:- start:230 stop:679 length:450 start_codon:yes stop_codon:yes gene_type:complete